MIGGSGNNAEEVIDCFAANSKPAKLQDRFKNRFTSAKGKGDAALVVEEEKKGEGNSLASAFLNRKKKSSAA